jgi:hypothetical protein
MTPPGYVNATDRTKLSNYLDNGGNLYIESVNIGKDYHTTTFFDYLGITFDGDGEDYEVSNVKGSCLNCSESLKFNYRGGFSPHYSVDRLGSDGGVLLFNSEDTFGRIFANEGTNYKVISSSLVIGAMETDEKLNLKPYLLSEFLNYFMEINPVTDLQENISGTMNMAIFPNPFQNETTVRFIAEQTGEVRVDIFDISGRWIKSLANCTFESGSHQVTWDGTDQQGSGVTSGQYFCRILTNVSVETHKLILLK